MQLELLKKLLPHKEHVTTYKNYMSFRKQHPRYELPHANTLINHFGAWNILKSNLLNEDVPLVKSNFTKEELLEIASLHAEHLTSTEKWEEYRRSQKELRLPSYITFVKQLGWNQVKKEVNQPINPQHRPQVFSDDELISIIHKHSSYLGSARVWAKYAAEHNLPSYYTFVKRLGRERFNSLRKNLQVEDEES